MLIKISYFLKALQSASLVADGKILFCLRYKHLNCTAGSKKQHALDVRITLVDILVYEPPTTNTLVHC